MKGHWITKVIKVHPLGTLTLFNTFQKSEILPIHFSQNQKREVETTLFFYWTSETFDLLVVRHAYLDDHHVSSINPRHHTYPV